MTRNKILIGFVSIVGLLLVYLLFWPVPTDPVAWTPPEAPTLTGVYEPNTRLAAVERLGTGAGIGPEDVAIDAQGRIYGSMEDGRILRFQAYGSQPEVFADTDLSLQGEGSEKTLSWNTYEPLGFNRIVKFPDLYEIRISVFAEESKSYTSKFYFLERSAEAGNVLRAGPHTQNCEYASVDLSFAGCIFKVEYVNIGNGELIIRVTPVSVAEPFTLIQLEVAKAWELEGEVELKDDGIISFPLRNGKAMQISAAQDFQSIYYPGTDVTKGLYSSSSEMIENLKSNGKLNEFMGKGKIAVLAFNARLPLKIIACMEKGRNIGDVDNIINDARLNYEKNHTKISGGEFEGCARAVTSVINWCTVYDALSYRPYTTVSRAWIDYHHKLILREWTDYYEKIGVDKTYRCRFIGLWDSLFSAILHSIESKKLSEADIMAVLDDFALVDGEFPPNFIGFGIKSYDRSQPPIGSLTVWKVYRKFEDRQFLEWAYPRLKRWHIWWKKNRDGNKDGLLEWGSNPKAKERGFTGGTPSDAKCESGLDNSPLYDDAEYDVKVGTMNLTDIGLNSLFAADAYYLSKIAAEVGFKSDSDEFKNEYEVLKRKINDELWNEEKGTYLDKYWSGEFSSRIAPTSFYPLLAKIPSKERAERIIKTHLLNENQFWGEFVIPSISRSDSSFTEQLYWRGRIWPPMNYLVYLGLKEYELDDVANELAKKSVSLFMKEWREMGHSHESYNGITGIGDDVPIPAKPYSEGSDRFYSWGALLPLMGVEEIIDVEMDEGIRFGCRFLEGRNTISNISIKGASYKIETSQAETVAFRDGKKFFSSKPGTNVRNYTLTKNSVNFRISGNGETHLTICEFNPDAEVLITTEESEKSIKADKEGAVTFNINLDSKYTKIAISNL